MRFYELASILHFFYYYYFSFFLPFIPKSLWQHLLLDRKRYQNNFNWIWCSTMTYRAYCLGFEKFSFPNFWEFFQISKNHRGDQRKKSEIFFHEPGFMVQKNFFFDLFFFYFISILWERLATWHLFSMHGMSSLRPIWSRSLDQNGQHCITSERHKIEIWFLFRWYGFWGQGT